MRRAVWAVGAGVVAIAAGLIWLSSGNDDKYDAVIRACAEAEHVDLNDLREAARATPEGHPGYPGSNLSVLLLPDRARGSAHCYFQMREGGAFTLLGSSRD
jgi:hypothetical protein